MLQNILKNIHGNTPYNITILNNHRNILYKFYIFCGIFLILYLYQLNSFRPTKLCYEKTIRFKKILSLIVIAIFVHCIKNKWY